MVTQFRRDKIASHLQLHGFFRHGQSMKRHGLLHLRRRRLTLR